MGKEAGVRDFARSFLPRQHLLNNRDVWALKFKHKRNLLGNRRAIGNVLLDPDQWRSWHAESIGEYRKYKYFGGVMVEGGIPFEYTAYDPLDPAICVRRSPPDATSLQVLRFYGAHHMRSQLELAAAYIARHEPLRKISLVAQLTYPAMGKLTIRLGFRPTTVVWTKESLANEAWALHLAYSEVNRKDPGPPEKFEPAAVYLPTGEFISRFSP